LTAATFHPGSAVRPALIEAGWSDEYRHDPTEWLRTLREEGFSINETAGTVLTHLGGLAVEPRPLTPTAFGSGTLVFEPLWAASGEHIRIVERESQVGMTLCPIGEWCGEYVLLAGEDGSIYAETTFQMVLVGQDIAEALRTMILADKRPTEV
jgi:hypothetical protein